MSVIWVKDCCCEDSDTGSSRSDYDAKFGENMEPTSTAQGDVVNSQPHSTTQPITSGLQGFPDTIQHRPDNRIQTSPVSMPQNTNSVPSEPPPSYNEAVTLQPSRLDVPKTII